MTKQEADIHILSYIGNTLASTSGYLRNYEKERGIELDPKVKDAFNIIGGKLAADIEELEKREGK